MNVIPFPGGKPPDGEDGDIERYRNLKRRLVAFVVEGPMRGRLDAEMEAEGVEGTDFAEFVDFTDWFIFDWEGDDGTCVLDEFLDSQTDLSDEDQQMLEDWYEPVHDLFQVVDLDDRRVTLRDGDGALYTAVPTNMTVGELGWRERTIVETRLLRVGEVYVLSGIQSFYDGAELQLLPKDFNAAALAHMSDEEAMGIADELAGEMEIGTAIYDVRELGPEERPPGSVAAECYDFLAETKGSVKPETLEAHALNLSLLSEFCTLRESALVEQFTDAELLRFVAIGFPVETPDRTAGAARQLLATMKRFTAWLDRRHATALHQFLVEHVLPAVKDDLPRVVRAGGEIDAAFPTFSVGQLLGVITDPETVEHEVIEGVFRVVAVEGFALTLAPHGHGAPDVGDLVVDFPGKAVRHMRLGDFVLCTLGRFGAATILEDVEAVFPPAAPL